MRPQKKNQSQLCGHGDRGPAVLAAVIGLFTLARHTTGAEGQYCYLPGPRRDSQKWEYAFEIMKYPLKSFHKKVW